MTAQLAAAYLVLQGALVLGWWALLWLAPETRSWFLPVGWPAAVLLAFALPDLLIVGLGSLLVGWAAPRGAVWTTALGWTVAGGCSYAALWTLNASISGGGAWTAPACMLPAGALSVWAAHSLGRA